MQEPELPSSAGSVSAGQKRAGSQSGEQVVLTSISCPGLSLLFVFQGVRSKRTSPAATGENVLTAWTELDSAAVRCRCVRTSPLTITERFGALGTSLPDSGVCVLTVRVAVSGGLRGNGLRGL